MSKPTLFIDGEHGTTGLLIRELLRARDDIDLVSIAADKRKDLDERKRLLNAVDLAVLCLPDDAARESVAMISNPAVRLVDASTAHRVAPDWTFGFPELAAGQTDLIRNSKRVTNPGCWSTCFIGMLRPLIDAGLVPPEFPVTTWGVSGYSGGGRQMIEAFELPEGAKSRTRFMAYGLKLAHKHLPEMQRYTGLAQVPLFTPSVGAYRQGMLMQLPLPLWALPGNVAAADIHRVLQEHYAGQAAVRVAPFPGDPGVDLEPEALNGTNVLELSVFGNEQQRQALVIARLDNLGKGAGRAALQNIDLMLGISA